MLFAQFMTTKESAAIVNMTSGLAFTPLAMAPTYSATKAFYQRLFHNADSRT
ncbi:SDR family NAD(P)-dependent oxidoreductase [Paenibacillus campinasensis]|uniref:SDR family NAD(P)-dependent oxidoreductase n=1 Tax=Paenibacillus campinasensis TaxID=66347 RepID=A0ABW9T544_9BACL|nr:SDR family NAD(P)-dependent oxidoreductase [Paenibacillus campinasensis]